MIFLFQSDKDGFPPLTAEAGSETGLHWLGHGVQLQTVPQSLPGLLQRNPHAALPEAAKQSVVNHFFKAFLS